MGMDASEIVTPFLGALQASIAVLLTIFFGVLAAQFNLLSGDSAKEVSRTCVCMFLPALLITNVGAELHLDTGIRYLPVLLWAIVYNLLSMLLGVFATRVFKLPAWVTPALAFNNTTSLPLLLIQSLESTGILNSILMGDSDTSSAAINRAKSYFLVNSMVSNSLTFALGPRLLRPHDEDASDDDRAKPDQGHSGSHDYPINQREEDVENAPMPVPGTTSNDNAPNGHHERESSEVRTREDAMQDFVDEETSLLPRALIQKSRQTEREGYRKGRHYWDRMPKWAQEILKVMYAFVNPPLIGALLGALIGLVPALHRLFFNDTNSGGYLNAWLTASIKNIGDLFASLQIIVVGVKLSQSLRKMKKGEESGAVPWRSMTFITFIRFILWPLISIPIIWAVATRTSFLDADPILWFAMMLMPAGPPAMILVALADVNGSEEKEKMAIAKFLTISYAITPLICLAVVGSLKASEAAIGSRP
ncbi:membrane transporter [Lophium mytilinum]|uniref:Membrane transporter n=1 Tax=Lophium mytilinum TaxID=390894 RepID=A0A6A6R0I7_9PEZI|nr:membrane transporter [Lophium mytilinum]